MNKITYEIEAGEYALIVKYRAYNQHISLRMGDNFSLVVPLDSLRELRHALEEIYNEVENRKFLQSQKALE